MADEVLDPDLDALPSPGQGATTAPINPPNVAPKGTPGYIKAQEGIDTEMGYQQNRRDILQQRQDAQTQLAGKYLGQAGDQNATLKQLYDSMTERIKNMDLNPGPAERWGMAAKALGTPSRSIGETFGNLGGASAEYGQAVRQNQFAKEQLVDKYGVEGATAMINANMMQAQRAQQMAQGLGSSINNANTDMRTLAATDARNNKANAPVVLNFGPDGKPTGAAVNQPFVQAKGEIAERESAARIHAALHGVNDPGEQNQLMDTARMIVDRKLPMPALSTRSPTGFALGNALNDMVKTMDPEFNAQDYKIAYETRKDFEAHGAQGDTVRSLNVAMTHLEAMRQWAKALNTGDSRTVNSIQQGLAREFGDTSVVDYNTAKQTVAGEATKAINGAKGSTLTDRVEQADHFAANNAPEQQESAINTLQSLMGGQIHGFRTKFRTGLRGVPADKADAEFNGMLDPDVLQLEQATKGGTDIRGAAQLAGQRAAGRSNPANVSTTYKSLAEVKQALQQKKVSYKEATAIAKANGWVK